MRSSRSRRTTHTVHQLIFAKGFINLAEFAVKAGLSAGTVSNVNRGLAPTPRVANAMADALGITRAELDAAIAATQRHHAPVG